MADYRHLGPGPARAPAAVEPGWALLGLALAAGVALFLLTGR